MFSLRFASINMALAIMLGAFGAHGLKGKVSTLALETFLTGNRYHLLMSLSLILLWSLQKQLRLDFKKPMGLIGLGIFLFSFNCYLYAITSIKTFALIVPFGGVSFIASWIWVSILLIRTHHD